MNLVRGLTWIVHFYLPLPFNAQLFRVCLRFLNLWEIYNASGNFSLRNGSNDLVENGLKLTSNLPGLPMGNVDFPYLKIV